MITLPSCDIRSPAPIPKKTSDNAKAVPFRVTSIVPTSTSAAIAIAPRPTWTTARGPNRTATFGPGERSGQHRDRHREEPLPRLERVEAEHDLEVYGQDEERAHHDQLLRR